MGYKNDQDKWKSLKRCVKLNSLCSDLDGHLIEFNKLTIQVELFVNMYPLDLVERSSGLSGALVQQAQEYDQVYLLKELEHLADFTIVIEESHPGRGVEVTKIPCNKFVLTKRSNYFSAMFEQLTVHLKV